MDLEEVQGTSLTVTTAVTRVLGGLIILKTPVELDSLRSLVSTFHPPQFIRKLSCDHPFLDLFAEHVPSSTW